MGARYRIDGDTTSSVTASAWSASDPGRMAPVGRGDWLEEDDLMLPAPSVPSRSVDPLMVALVGLVGVAGVCLMIFAAAVAMVAMVVLPL